eukprot:CAMPEP_0172175672 /NCGR_PEP_ID=MMETSP1050-20130122/14365_1 /TAXON_ID=233186 /ORGANISM="Cryptomonas curvata, Strain CCAP979/52" /LENGTH=93 /DNA_ID=CAMNT_0012847815 /DNA_START=174 /DNA_END=451 /DNA_ORIENTATION=+
MLSPAQVEAQLIRDNYEVQEFFHDFSIFIEDTDCFQVVYNANYLKFCDRARQLALGLPSLAALRAAHGPAAALVTTRVDAMRFHSAAALGDDV